MFVIATQSCEDVLEDRMNSLWKAIEFYDKAMSQSDNGLGIHRDAIDWLRSASEEAIDAYNAQCAYNAQ